MPINAIQFQHGLSLPEFQALYGSEDQCERCWPPPLSATPRAR